MKIMTNQTWVEHDGLIKKLIKEKNRQEETIDVLIKTILDLRAENARLFGKIMAKEIGAKFVEDNIDFPNSQKGGFEDSNIFLL